MNVLLDIISLVNRGDWLMFEAMLEQIRARRPEANVGVPEQTYNLNPYFYAQKVVVPVINPVGKSEWLRKCIIKTGAFLLHRRRPLYSNEIDLVLFSPGFRFSDQFGMPPNEFIDYEQKWFGSFSKRGHRFYFMPQAFGPFASEANMSRIRRLLSFATHIYPRERTSYENILPLAPIPDKVSISPDFTCLYKGEPYELPFAKGNYVVVVPNRQMLVRASEGIAGKYCEFMFRLVRWLKEHGENIVLLNHEGANDIGLIEVLNAAIDNTAHTVCGVSGGACKSVIAEAKLVVTSRFHGLISALAEGSPALCTSWSHKYQELVDEMGCRHSCLDLKSVEKAMETVEDALHCPGRYSSSAAKRAELERKVLSMWDEILPIKCDATNKVGAYKRRKMFYIAPARWNALIWLFKLPRKLFCF